MALVNNELYQAQKYNLPKIKSLLENGLMHDWAISIEYAVKIHRNKSEWLQWDKTFFALDSADPVIEKLKECCQNNPECSLKLVCQKFSPECRLVYCIYKERMESVGD